ncbi:hypothetical protein VB636_09955, partial [Paracoccus sp. APAP_BH8]
AQHIRDGYAHPCRWRLTMAEPLLRASRGRGNTGRMDAREDMKRRLDQQLPRQRVVPPARKKPGRPLGNQRIETAFQTCVGRIRYLGVMLYDADKIAEAAAAESEMDLYDAQLDLGGVLPQPGGQHAFEAGGVVGQPLDPGRRQQDGAFGDSFPLWFAAMALLSGSGTVLNARYVVRLGMRRTKRARATAPPDRRAMGTDRASVARQGW